MSDAIEIRLGVSSDEGAVRQCALEAYQRYVADIGKPPAPMQADFRVQLEGGSIRVAVDNAGIVVGYVSFAIKNDTAYLDSVAVINHAQGRGIGRLLIETCEGIARSECANRIELYTNTVMSENLSLYPYLGYTELSRRQQDGFDRVYFEKNIEYTSGDGKWNAVKT